MTQQPPEKVIGYVFNLVTGLAESQQLTLSGNLALGATKEEMGEEFDKLLAVTNRLAAKHKIEKKKADIAADEAMINSMKSDLAQLDESKEGKIMNVAEKNNKEAMKRNIRHLEGRAAGFKQDLDGLLKEAE
jgi:hypothetical protein